MDNGMETNDSNWDDWRQVGDHVIEDAMIITMSIAGRVFVASFGGQVL